MPLTNFDVFDFRQGQKYFSLHFLEVVNRLRWIQLTVWRFNRKKAVENRVRIRSAFRVKTSEFEVFFLDVIPFSKTLNLSPVLLMTQIINVTLKICRVDELHGVIAVGLKAYKCEEKFLHFIIVKRFHQTFPNAV